MNRRFWSGALIVSLLVTAAAGFYVFTQVQNKEIVAMMPVETVHEASATTTAPAPSAPAPLEKTAAAPAPAPVVQTLKSDDEPATPAQKRNILFSLPRPNAKAVFIIGDFNDWKEDTMVKKDKKWQRSVALEPGTYKYMFVVDKKQIRDPNNKVSSDGKSLITVKPLSPGK